MALLLVIDLLLVYAAAFGTGASKSPFLGQFYLIVFAAALFFGLRGGAAAGITAALFTLGLGIVAPEGLRQDTRDLIPYFPIAGAFTGYLSNRVRKYVRQQRAEAEREQERLIREEKHRYEMELARTIQETAQVPSNRIPDNLHLDVSVYRAFAREIGGDFVLTFLEDGESDTAEAVAPSRHGRLGLAVGDVSGKGIPAALTANSIAYLLPWLHPLEDVGKAITLLNQDLVCRLPDSAFVTLTLAEVVVPADGGSGRIRVWNAGHPPAILWHARTGETEIAEEEGGGSVLGVFSDWEPHAPWEVRFDPGDVLVLYSDGLIETRRPSDGEFLGTEHVARLIAEYAVDDPRELTLKLAGAADDWGPPQDDMTILACRYRTR